jgi:hypothetical protein
MLLSQLPKSLLNIYKSDEEIELEEKENLNRNKIDLSSLHRSSKNDFYFPLRLHITAFGSLFFGFCFSFLIFYLIKGILNIIFFLIILL